LRPANEFEDNERDMFGEFPENGAREVNKTASKTGSAVKRSTHEVVRLMFPVYFVEEQCVREEIMLARLKWNMILNNTAPYFITMKGKPGFEQTSCIALFYDSFYNRLFDVHPLAKPMFSAGLKSQGKFLVKMMSLTLNLADQQDKFDEAMVKLAEVHNDRGIKAVEYGVVGEVLFWTLRRCLGPEYDTRTHKAWVKIFSRMLSVIVPCAVQFEMSSGEAQEKRLSSSKRSDKKRMFDEEMHENEGSVSSEQRSEQRSTGFGSFFTLTHSHAHPTEN